MRIVRALAALAAQPRGTRRLLTVRFASNNAVADAEVLAGLNDPVILDVRDPAEVEAGKGGPPASVPGAVHVPLNVDGVKQSERPTTQEEFLAAVAAAGLALPRIDRSSRTAARAAAAARRPDAFTRRRLRRL